MKLTPNILFRNVRPVGDAYNGEATVDVLVENGRIASVGSHLSALDGAEIVECHGNYVSGGWMDMHVHLREPGFEYKETIESGCAAAAAGGFTAVACMPNTNPPVHTRNVVEFILAQAKPFAVDVYPIACVSKDRHGKSLSEMGDLKDGGAVGFSDDGEPVQDAKLMRIALEYSSMLGLPIINHEEDLSLSRPGYMHEGAVSTRLGLAGTPSVAEEIMIARDIMLAELTGGHVHVAHISTRKGVDLVRQAKKAGIRVTTEVCPHHFDLTDEALEIHPFDTNYKMHPPLRTADDVQAMIEGLADGTIDAICTDHAPHAVHEKEVEFIYAPNGILGLQTAWPITVKRLLDTGVLSLRAIIEKLVDNPRKVLNLPVPEINPGATANLTFFNTDEEWMYGEAVNKSKSKNSPYLGQRLKGRVFGVYNKHRWVPNM